MQFNQLPMSWSSRPFARIFFFYVSGIFLARYLGSYLPVSAGWELFVFLTLLFANIFLIFQKPSWKMKLFPGVFAALLIVFIGFWTTQQKLKLPSIHLIEVSEYYSAEVVKDPLTGDKSVKTVLKVLPLNDTSSGSVKPIRVMAFLLKDSKSEQLRYGDKLVFYARLTKPEPPKNPYEFNYAQFLSFNEINYTVFLSSKNWELTSKKSAFSLKLIAADLRNYLLTAFKENGLSGENYAVAAAMILGYDDLMEPEAEQDFVQAGAMHILCVSGLHVGVIYFVVNFLLGFLNRNRFQQIFKALLLLLVVWFYALLTGLSPSVQRASVMLSVFIIGNAIQRDRDSLNTLAASAVLLLIFNPMLIFNVGFQLSYSAVLGILIFHRPIYSLIYLKNRMLDKLWSVSVVSFAAQLGTFPLAAHYFHFFPTYFWFTNLLVLPLSFLIIGTGFLFVVVSWIPFVSAVVGFCLSAMVSLLNLIVGVVDYLPYNGFRNLYYPWVKVFVVYSLILMLFQLLINKKIRLLLPTLVAVFVLVSFNFYRNYTVQDQNRIVVYQINKHSAISFIEGEKQICLVDSVLFTDDRKADFQMANSEINWGVGRRTVRIDSVCENTDPGFVFDKEFGFFGNFSFVIITDQRYFPINKTSQIAVDMVIVCGKKYLNLAQLKKSIDFDFMVMDGSVPYYKQKKLKQAADTLRISFYNTSKSGAYIKEFEPLLFDVK